MTKQYSDCKQGALSSGALFCHAPQGEAGEQILIHPSRPRWLRGNGTTAWIAQKLAASKGNAESVAEALASRYGLPSEIALADVSRVREILARHGLLEPDTPEPRSCPALQSVFLMLTEACNLACVHCSGGRASRTELPLATVLRLAEELIEAGGRKLTLSGGEPLLYTGLETLLTRVGRRIPVHFCTNGILIDETWARWVGEHLEATFQISLDGPNAEIHDAVRGAGAFEGAMRGLRALQTAGLGDRITLAATIQSANLEALPDMLAWVSQLGVPKLRFLPVRPVGRALDTWEGTGKGLDVSTYEAFFDRFLSDPGIVPKGLDLSIGLSGFALDLPEGQDHWCTVGHQVVVAATGKAYPCACLIQDQCYLGNVLDCSLQDVIKSPRMVELHAVKFQRKDRIKACESCTWRAFCQSGCMAEAFQDTGSLWEPDRMCGLRRRAYARAFDVLLAAPSKASEGS
ncbi:MAG: radical SAM protein [Desulfobacterota bacterium]|jgi:radical SAM protein with 4Fe4S-binding SPASM domain|nr:radical SAM protein [Thermodesulfobacteriota bacterium]